MNQTETEMTGLVDVGHVFLGQSRSLQDTDQLLTIMSICLLVKERFELEARQHYSSIPPLIYVDEERLL